MACSPCGALSEARIAGRLSTGFGVLGDLVHRTPANCVVLGECCQLQRVDSGWSRNRRDRPEGREEQPQLCPGAYQQALNLPEASGRGLLIYTAIHRGRSLEACMDAYSGVTCPKPEVSLV
ncbi:hypothetical protein TREES_T100000194 [Tupaia chinensis]|uniref:Uncharacterized protein n=1 Tax=Tupaia chinensis TaxID=246437 RepID=L9L836_TUPCH|nr:hypothetical protein TREES_T100000194 [Tupaia chinensis]